MLDVFFLVQDRGGGKNTAHSGGKLHDKGMWFSKSYINKVLDSVRSGSVMIKYAELGEYFESLKTMPVDVFRGIFSDSEIEKLGYILDYDSSVGFNDTLFSKEIHTTFGKDISSVKDRTKLKPSQLRAGGIYLDKDGKKLWLYLGDVKFETFVDKEKSVYEGNMFVDYSRFKELDRERGLLLQKFIALDIQWRNKNKFPRIDILKGKKTVIQEVDYIFDACKCLYDEEFVFEVDKDFIYRYKRQIGFKITLKG